MAEISIYDVTYSGCKLKLKKLTTSGIEYDRTVLYYVNDLDYNNVWVSGYTDLEPNVGEGAEVTVTGLSASTMYYVDCYVYRTDTGEQIWRSENNKFITAEAPEFYISSLEVEQTKLGELKAVVSFDGYNIVGGTYSIKAVLAGSSGLYTKASGTVTASSMSVEISFDNFDTYEVWVIIEKYGGSQIETVEVEIKDYIITNPITSFTVDQRSLSETLYNQGIVRIDSYINLSNVSFYLTDVTTGNFYDLELDWVENGAGDDIYYVASCYFGPVNTLGTHIFELNYTYIINWALSTQATFQEPYDLTISNLQIEHGYKSLIFSCAPAPETRRTVTYSVQYKSGSDYNYFGSSSANSTVTVSNKPFGKSYDIRMRALISSIAGNELTATVTVPPAPPTIDVSASDSTIKVVYGVTNNTYIDEFVFTLYSESGLKIDEKTVQINSTESVSPSGTILFSGLQKGSYYIRATTIRNGIECFVSADSDARYVQSKVLTVTVSSAIDLWEWTSTDDRTTAHQAITGGGRVNDFKYTVWNDLCAKVKEALEAETGGQWDDTFASFEDTCMTDTQEGRKLTAIRFNSLRKNVGNKEATGIKDKLPGNEVIGAEFITITEALNTFINKLNANS